MKHNPAGPAQADPEFDPATGEVMENVHDGPAQADPREEAAIVRYLVRELPDLQPKVGIARDILDALAAVRTQGQPEGFTLADAAAIADELSDRLRVDVPHGMVENTMRTVRNQRGR